MNKRVFGLVAVLMLAVAAIGWYTFFSSVTSFEGEFRYFYIHPDSTSRNTLLANLQRDSILRTRGSFDWLARQRDYYEHVKPGKYKIEKGTNPVSLLRILSGQQEEEKLVINKIRLTEDLASLIARRTMHSKKDALLFVNSNDSLKPLQTDTMHLLSHILPNTYNIYWTSDIATILGKLKKESDDWWAKDERKNKLQKLGLNAHEVYTLASIVDEETNKAADKPLIASVYLNRLKKGMPLQADPTIRFARRDFASNRVTYAQLKTPSPYNTYINRGLPPGPICTAQPATIDSVLHAPDTDYLYFVAKADFSGYSIFSTNLRDHTVAAREYQDSLNAWLQRKAEKEKAKADSLAGTKTP